MNLRPWREVITPHRDVLEGTFKQSEFAADLTQVVHGEASTEYCDAVKFYSRTYITEGMSLLLRSVAQRLAGKGGDPVIQLQTAFGGGKTHTLLAVYHLARREVSTERLMGIPPILDKAQITSLPQAKVAVIDGIRLSPGQPRKYGSITIKTLWGELAWQLGGEPAFRLVESADQNGTSPGKETLSQIIKGAAPCVILMDELVAFIRQMEAGRSYPAGTFESNISFIQALTEAMKSVPNAILLASLPESELELGGAMGKLALDSLEKYFARIESVWKPVATEEAFEIVKRRLFDGKGNQSDVDRVCRAFFDYYISNNTKFPNETQTNNYLDRLKKSYPIHPEVFDRLYEDWSTLEKFQRTRGVLQYLAIVIHRLWNSGNRDALIMPASIPLEDSNVRTKSIHYLPQGWEPVIEGEIDGPRSKAYEIDSKEARFGAIEAARRAARTVFLGSAPGNASQNARGITTQGILLGSCHPGQTVNTYEDVLGRLQDNTQHLYQGNGRYWFDPRPTLRREMEARKQRLSFGKDVLPLVKKILVDSLRGSNCFEGIHVFAPSEDIPDEIGNGPRLVVLQPGPSSSYSKANEKAVNEACLEYLRKRGNQPRLRQNRLIFLVADFGNQSRMIDNAETFIAWESIVDDIKNEKINLDMAQIKQAKKDADTARQIIEQSVRDSFKHILCPFEEITKGRQELIWEVTSLSHVSGNLARAVEEKLRQEEWLIFEWASIHLSRVLSQWYINDNSRDVVTRKLWNDMASYLYLPRLKDEKVLKDAIAQGIISEDFFGYAQGKESDKYLGLVIGRPGDVTIDESSVLIDKRTALEAKARAEVEHNTPVSPGGPTVDGQQHSVPREPSSTLYDAPIDQNGAKKLTKFFAVKDLDVRAPKPDFSKIIDEIVLHLTTNRHNFVSISVEIQAENAEGFDEATQRTLNVNCSATGFRQHEFSED